MSNVGPSLSNPLSSQTVPTIDTRANLTGISIPLGLSGALIFVAEAGITDYYGLNMASGAVVDGTNVLATSRGGTSRWLKMGLPATGATPGGANTDVQFNDVGVFGGAVHATYDKVGGFLTVDIGVNVGAGPYAPAGQIRMTDTNSIEFPGFRAIKGTGAALEMGDTVGVVNNILESIGGGSIAMQPGANTKFAVTATGGGGGSGGAWFFANAPSFGGGQDVIFIASTAVPPTANPVGGGILYIDAVLGLLFRGTAGTVTPIAPM